MIKQSETSTMQLAPENLTGILPGTERKEIEAKLLETAGSRRKLRRLREDVLVNRDLKTAFGDRLPQQFDDLVDRVQTESASRDFKAKVEKRSWGKWALEKVKSVVLFPVRHPVYTLLIAAAALAGVGFYYGNLGELLLKTIPNYSGKAAEVLRSGMKYASEKLGLAGEAAYSGNVPLSTSPGVPNPYENPLVPGLFTSAPSPAVAAPAITTPTITTPAITTPAISTPVAPPLSPPPAGPGDFGVTPF